MLLYQFIAGSTTKKVIIKTAADKGERFYLIFYCLVLFMAQKKIHF